MRRRNACEAESSKSSEVQLERLQEQGIINDRGEVTGQLRRWNAFLAITAVKRVAGTREIAVFRCLKPVFGMPGGATIDVSRDSMVAYLKEGKKVITALRDDRLEIGRKAVMFIFRQRGSSKATSQTMWKTMWEVFQNSSNRIRSSDPSASTPPPSRSGMRIRPALKRRNTILDHKPLLAPTIPRSLSDPTTGAASGPGPRTAPQWQVRPA